MRRKERNRKSTVQPRKGNERKCKGRAQKGVTGRSHGDELIGGGQEPQSTGEEANRQGKEKEWAVITKGSQRL